MTKIFYSTGIFICLLGGGLMFDGAVLGEVTTNIATVLVILGMGLIATQRAASNKGGE